MVVTGNVHAHAVEQQLPDLDEAHLILEPSPRDSTAAIALAAAVLALRQPDVIIGSFAADHVILDQAEFHKSVLEAIDVAATGKIVTIGLRPTEPSVGFGYIQKGEPLDSPTACQVLKFVEKPNIKVAKQYVESGDYFWNAGMFIAKASLLLSVLEQTEPELHRGIMEIAKAWDTPARESVLKSVWPKLKRIAIEFEWHDVGDFASIAELQSQGRKGNLAVLGSAKVLSDSSSGILVSDTDRLIALIGLEDVIVVDTPDALLITTKEHAQKVKSLVDVLKQTGHSELL